MPRDTPGEKEDVERLEELVSIKVLLGIAFLLMFALCVTVADKLSALISKLAIFKSATKK